MGHHESEEYLFLMFLGVFCLILVSNFLILCGLGSRTTFGILLLILICPPFVSMITTLVAPESRISILIYRFFVPWMHLYWCIFLAAGLLNLCFLVVWLLGLY